jgi:acyl-CoA synthetase (AMP-forming)/AMP-acid ligase II
VHHADVEQARLRISRELAVQVSRHVGHLPRHVVLLAAGGLPRTLSGKPRRCAARELLSAFAPISDVHPVI